MSINLHLQARIMATIKISGKEKRKEIIEEYELRQTPTVITDKCLAGNAYELYKEWVMTWAGPEKIYIYKEDDILEEGEPIGYEMYDPGKVHIEELDEWLKDHEGWIIKWYGM